MTIDNNNTWGGYFSSAWQTGTAIVGGVATLGTAATTAGFEFTKSALWGTAAYNKFGTMVTENSYYALDAVKPSLEGLQNVWIEGNIGAGKILNLGAISTPILMKPLDGITNILVCSNWKDSVYSLGGLIDINTTKYFGYSQVQESLEVCILNEVPTWTSLGQYAIAGGAMFTVGYAVVEGGKFIYSLSPETKATIKNGVVTVVGGAASVVKEKNKTGMDILSNAAYIGCAGGVAFLTGGAAIPAMAAALGTKIGYNTVTGTVSSAAGAVSSMGQRFTKDTTTNKPATAIKQQTKKEKTARTTQPRKKYSVKRVEKIKVEKNSDLENLKKRVAALEEKLKK